MSDVIVVGAGPVGMLLAGLLERSGVEVLLLERRDQPGGGTRAIGIHPPTLAALEPSGLTDALLSHALRVPHGEARADGKRLGLVRFDRLSTRFPFVATLPQSATEAVLAAAAPPPRRGFTATRIRSTPGGLVVHGADGSTETARSVVVAGGGRARPLVFRDNRLKVTNYRDRYLMADVEVPHHPQPDTAIVNLAPGGVLESFPMPGGVRRFVAWDGMRDADDAQWGASDAQLAERLRAAMRSRGEAESAAAVSTATSFGVRRVVAPAFSRGGLFVIGDTAHEVSPIGGQGMNLGLLDAVTLAPVLASWVHTAEPPGALIANWEQRRRRSALTAARLAALNTVIGRPRGPAAHTMRSLVLRAMLGGPGGQLFAHAYAMGLDRDS